jgi:dTDP-4-dehydrorhamnose 3,5-epimerase
MEIIDTPIRDVFLIKPNVFRDERGYFFESYHQKRFHEQGIDCHFVQDNEAKSDKGVLRGLHYQRGASAQAKLVRVVTGSVYDVVVDIRPQSTTFGKWFGAELSAENGFQLFVPKGFAHGYLVLEDNTIFAYKCDQYYNRESEGGIKFDDPNLNIDWPSMDEPFIVSAKDRILPYLGSHLT